MPNLDCLFTIVENTSGSVQNFSFLPPHGVVLDPGEQYTVLGSFVGAIQATSGGPRKLDAMLISVLSGQLSIIQSNIPFLRDHIFEMTKITQVIGDVLILADDCTQLGAITTPILALDARVQESFVSDIGVGVVSDMAGVERWGDFNSVGAFGWDDPNKPLHFAAIKFSGNPTWRSIIFNGMPAVQKDGVDDTFQCFPYSDMDPGPPVFLEGTKTPLTRQPEFTFHMIMQNFGTVGVGDTGGLLLASHDHPLTVSTLEWALAVLEGTQEITFAVIDSGLNIYLILGPPVGLSDQLIATVTHSDITGDSYFYINGALIGSILGVPAQDADPSIFWHLSMGGTGFLSALRQKFDLALLYLYPGILSQDQLVETATPLAAAWSLPLGSF